MQHLRPRGDCCFFLIIRFIYIFSLIISYISLLGIGFRFHLYCTWQTLLQLRASLPIRRVSRFWWGNWTVASQPASQYYSDRRGKTVYPVFNRPIFWVLDYQNRTRLKRSDCNLRLLASPKCHQPTMPAITRAATNKLYFLCIISNPFSHNRE